MLCKRLQTLTSIDLFLCKIPKAAHGSNMQIFSPLNILDTMAGLSIAYFVMYPVYRNILSTNTISTHTVG